MSEMSPFQPIKLQYVKPFEHLKHNVYQDVTGLQTSAMNDTQNRWWSIEKKLCRGTSDTRSQVGGRFIHESCSVAHEAKTSWLSCIKLPDPSTMWSYWSMCPLIQTAWVAFHLEWAPCTAQPSSDTHPGGLPKLKWIFGNLLMARILKQGNKLAAMPQSKQRWDILSTG